MTVPEGDMRLVRVQYVSTAENCVPREAFTRKAQSMREHPSGAGTQTPTQAQTTQTWT